MFDLAKPQTDPGHAAILDIEVMSMDEDARSAEALRAQLSPPEAAEWTRVCVRQHLI